MNAPYFDNYSNRQEPMVCYLMNVDYLSLNLYIRPGFIISERESVSLTILVSSDYPNIDTTRTSFT